MDKDNQYKQDILEAIAKIQQSTQGLSYEAFLNDADIFDACVRRLEIIGEAVKRLSDNFKSKLPEVPWKEIAGFRDKAIHDYASLHAGIVWETIQSDLSPLQKALMK
jgi:uncharacterized protein with HEPN domain